MMRSHREIYEAEKKAAANISSTEGIALNAMFTLEKELVKEQKANGILGKIDKRLDELESEMERIGNPAYAEGMEYVIDEVRMII
jgi:hypothetical protein